MTDWESCEAVERHADKLGGAGCFKARVYPCPPSSKISVMEPP